MMNVPAHVHTCSCKRELLCIYDINEMDKVLFFGGGGGGIKKMAMKE